MLESFSESYAEARGKFLAAMFDLCGDAETDFVVQTFFAASRGEQSAFFHETRRRKPRPPIVRIASGKRGRCSCIS